MGIKNIKAFQAFFNTTPKPHKVTKFDPPVMKRLVESIRTDVMLGESDADFGIDELVMKMTMAELDPQVYDNFGICNGGALQVRILGSEESEECDFNQHEWFMKGRWLEVNQGTIEAGKPNTQELTTQKLIEYSYFINGVEQVYIDVKNGVERYKGVDRTALRRAAIGYAG